MTSIVYQQHLYKLRSQSERKGTQNDVTRLFCIGLCTCNNLIIDNLDDYLVMLDDNWVTEIKNGVLFQSGFLENAVWFIWSRKLLLNSRYLKQKLTLSGIGFISKL